MLLVKTKIGPSKVAGIGLFAHEFIAKGTPVWKFMSDFDQKISEKKTAEFSESARGQFLNYAYFNQKPVGIYYAVMTLVSVIIPPIPIS
ncbi:MAG: hypothetical protein WCF77_02970 [Minisyncoccia bacterium]